ncbi:MAG: NRDE family protein [Planctomycetota bacterium]
MCTLTWLHEGDGYRLWFNRDELLTRGPELPPAVAETPAGRYIAPADSDQGGTWIATNDAGVTVALLNGYRDSRGPERPQWTSRGHLVRELALMRDASSLWRALSPARLAEFRPLVLVVVGPKAPALSARWDGLDLVMSANGDEELPVCSSSFRQDEVQRARRALYATLVSGAGGRSAARLAAFQSHTGPHGADAYSPCMRREDAATRSQCRVQVDAREVRFEYVPGPPNETEARPAVVLARRRKP